MTKAIVITVGNFGYLDNGQYVEEFRPCVVEVNGFIESKIAEGKIKLVTPNLPKEANDAEFVEYLNEAGKEHGGFNKDFPSADKVLNFAAASYASKFGLDETGNALDGGKVRQEKTDHIKTAAGEKLTAKERKALEAKEAAEAKEKADKELADAAAAAKEAEDAEAAKKAAETKA